MRRPTRVLPRVQFPNNLHAGMHDRQSGTSCNTLVRLLLADLRMPTVSILSRRHLSQHHDLL